jgi:hypothetical protein
MVLLESLLYAFFTIEYTEVTHILASYNGIMSVLYIIHSGMPWLFYMTINCVICVICGVFSFL